MTTSTNPALAYLALPWSWSIDYDKDDDCWVATIAELPDFFAAGKTSGEAAGNAREALLSHLSGYLTTGTPIPVPANVGVFMNTNGVENPTDLIEVAA